MLKQEIMINKRNTGSFSSPKDNQSKCFDMSIHYFSARED